ncbi:Kinesin light chain 3 [Rhizophlyctis rosea]|nr:Kinesin light chain 3 [Rhizophlyctis rosea]
MLGGEPIFQSGTENGALSSRGVRLSFLSTFVKECGGRDKFLNLTTRQVCDSFVKTRTDFSKSLCDQLASNAHDFSAAAASNAVGPATWFVTHCWQYKFLDVLDAIEGFFADRKEDASEVIVWFDLFCLPQQHRLKITPEWLQTKFTTLISTIPNTLLVLTAATAAPVALTRAWCIFELYTSCSVQANANFHIALPPSARSAYRDALREDGSVFYQTLASSIDFRSSQATEKEDLLAIKEVIREGIGFTALNRMALSLLYDWTREQLQILLEAAGKDGASNDLEVAKWRQSLARLYHKRGLHKEAEPLYAETLEKRNQLLGEDHPDTLTTIFHLANLYTDMGELDMAEISYKECLKGRKETLGDDHATTILTMDQFAAIYIRRRKYTEAEPLLVHCLEYRLSTLGEDHPHTLTNLGNLAALYAESGKVDKGERMYLTCLEKRRKVLGDDHPQTLSTMDNLAVLYNSLRMYGKAEPLWTECLERRRKVLGEEDVSTLEVGDRLADLYRVQKCCVM